MPNKERLQSIDLAKGFGIILVALVHCVDITFTETGTHVFNILLGLFGALMGVFFFFSGYFYKPGKSYFEKIKSRFFNLLLPYLVLMVLVCVIGYFAEWILAVRPSLLTYLIQFGKSIIDTNAFSFYEYYSYYQANIYLFLIPSWFVLRLFFCDLIFYAIADFCLKNIKNLIVSILVLLSITAFYQRFVSYHLPFQIESCFAIVALMLFAAYCSRYKFVEKLATEYKKKTYWIIFAVFLLAYAVCCVYLSDYYGFALMHGGFKWYSSSLESCYVWFFCQIVCTYIFLYMCTWLSKIPYITKPIIYCGKCSPKILAFHVLTEWILLKILCKNGTLFIDKGKVVDTPIYYQIIAFLGAILIITLVNYGIDLLKNRLKRRKVNEKN